MLRQFFQEKKYLGKLIQTKFLLTVVAVLAIFNLLSTKILPKDLFLVLAADIDVNELVALANGDRVSRGIHPLTIDSRLVKAAYEKGQDMLTKDYWAHYGPNGETPWQFIIANGYDYIYAGENLAKDFSSTAPIHSAWMASPSHRSNLLNESFTNIGIAAVSGEFQGEETTIVVQMFGSTQAVMSETNPLSDSENAGESGLPTTGESALESPAITYPEDGEILKEAAFSIRGQAREGSSVEVYDSDLAVGSTDIENSHFDFKKETPFSEGGHSLSAKAKDGYIKVSLPSNTVNITVDTISPYISRDTAQIEYIEIGISFKKFTFTLAIEDNPAVVNGVYKDEEVMFIQENGKWQGVFNETEDTFGDFKIIAQDVAGNSAEVVYTGEEIYQMASDVSEVKGLESVLRKWIVEDVFARILTRSLRGQINFAITLIMMAMLAFEWIVLAKTGFTKEKSSPALHLGVFAVLLFVGLLGSGGEIL